MKNKSKHKINLAFALLLLAVYLVVLFHSIIPHHHHYSHISGNLTHCQADVVTTVSASDFCSHDHSDPTHCHAFNVVEYYSSSKFVKQKFNTCQITIAKPEFISVIEKLLIIFPIYNAPDNYLPPIISHNTSRAPPFVA